MRVEQGVKVVSPGDFQIINEHHINEQYPDNYGRIHYYHVRKGFSFICTCDNLQTAIEIAKALNKSANK